MTFVSYAQNCEDVLLWRALRHVENGFYVDVGANDPDWLSVTRAFYERGWHGINIEPMSQYYAPLMAKRARDINIQACVGTSSAGITFYNIPSTGLSTNVVEIANQHRVRGFEVEETWCETRTLDSILSEINPLTIHFLKVDVEGAEEVVLKSCAFVNYRPWIVMVEATVPLSQETIFLNWDSYLVERRYEFAYFDGLNRYYVAAEHVSLKETFQAPPNFFDDYLIAHMVGSGTNDADKIRSEFLPAYHQIDAVRAELEAERNQSSAMRAELEQMQQSHDAELRRNRELEPRAAQWDELERRKAGRFFIRLCRLTGLIHPVPIHHASRDAAAECLAFAESSILQELREWQHRVENQKELAPLERELSEFNIALGQTRYPAETLLQIPVTRLRYLAGYVVYQGLPEQSAGFRLLAKWQLRPVFFLLALNFLPGKHARITGLHIALARGVAEKFPRTKFFLKKLGRLARVKIG
jgi:FkbM family methyltransferase